MVPLTVTAAPSTAIVGLKPVIAGAPPPLTTENAVELFADPFGDVIAIAPVVAPEGTVTTNVVVDPDVIEAEVPLNVTVF